MTSLKKKPRHAEKPPPCDSHWTEAAKEIGAVVALAALPILIKTASEALARAADKRTARKRDVQAKKTPGA